jgi:hypothetical protein
MLGLNAMGERQKSRDQDFGAVDTEAPDPFFKTSIIRLEGLGKVLISSGINDSFAGWNATYGIFMSSRTSLIVNAAYII